MDIPKNWEDCTVIARKITVPPQVIAKAYGIKPDFIVVGHSVVSDKGLQLMLDFTSACERDEVEKALAILREYFKKYTGSRADSEYVFKQAMYLGNEELASAALKKMIAQTPD
jgi:hypothetical protein